MSSESRRSQDLRSAEGSIYKASLPRSEKLFSSNRFPWGGLHSQTRSESEPVRLTSASVMMLATLSVECHSNKSNPLICSGEKSTRHVTSRSGQKNSVKRDKKRRERREREK